MEKILKNPLDCKGIKRVEINPAYSLEGLMLKLKPQYFGCLMLRTIPLENTLMLGKIWNQKEKGVAEDEMIGWYRWLMDMDLGKLWGIVKDRGSWRAAFRGV